MPDVGADRGPMPRFESRGRSLLRWLSGGVILVALSVAGAWVYFQRGESTPAKADPVTEAHPSVKIVIPGKVEAVAGELQLALDTPGVIRKLTVDEGDWVE